MVPYQRSMAEDPGVRSWLAEALAVATIFLALALATALSLARPHSNTRPDPAALPAAQAAPSDEVLVASMSRAQFESAPPTTPTPTPTLLPSTQLAPWAGAADPALFGMVPVGAAMDDPSLEPLRTKIDRFFETLSRDNIDRAYFHLLDGARLASQPGVYDSLVLATREAIRQAGTPSDALCTAVRLRGPRLARITYLAHGRAHPLEWSFICYHTGSDWELLDISISNDIPAMFDPTPRRTPPSSDAAAATP
jgi:hypothetical protein